MSENEIILRENKSLREKYYLIRHQSGVKIYVFPKKMSTCYALFATKYGAIDNCFRYDCDASFVRVPDGIAHFLEHKLFEMEDGSDTDARFASLGASSNAFTSADVTAYEFSCTDHVYEALEILLDFVLHPYFTEESVKKELGIIGQEIDMCDDMPMRRLYYEILAALYHFDNTRISVCGTQASIAEITPEHLYTCYRAFYQPSNMTLVICGDVDACRIEQIADATICKQENRHIERYFEAEPNEVAKNRRTVCMGVARPLFAIGIKDVHAHAGTREGARRGLLGHLLTEWIFGTSSVFYEKMYDAGLLNAKFNADYEGYRTCGFFLLTGEAEDPEKIFCAVKKALDDAMAEPPPEEDFLRIRKAMYAEHVRNFDSTETIANNLLSYSFFDVDLLEVGDLILSIGYNEVLTVMRDIFIPEHFAMATVMPKKTTYKKER